ncbi:uncharacterized protein FOMMEDRAFT_29651 [Fomitiporia mediterranea MF3/22]|uniref:uncharacterized protein n=1 Tax=Fomitiporia mediterranea (strain MF3/22) TaxID=694068 RepID=UPI0004407479|nr:uncharacterized protein FOMMEDRAFT_29651 [Fomitiporia mediterranea MF3/22]EJD00839.1 hypothetical protein FOMMEDRAFT_29651 [Fomitiporia mediterranea MF3/22]
MPSPLDCVQNLNCSDTLSIAKHIDTITISAFNIARYHAIAIFAIVFYDIIITLDQENRYIGVIGAVANVITKTRFSHYSFNILLLRVVALYYNNRRLETVLKVNFAVSMIAGLGLLVYYYVPMNNTYGLFTNSITMCTTQGSFHKQFVQVILHIVLFCVANIISLSASGLNPAIALLINFMGSQSALSIVGNRLLINLREAVEKSANGWITDGIGTISEMQFS